ncbi:toll/interleukin-1 receptor domain-containing protein [Paucibacter sp. R3-3]|uniref:Toll/interleukin-1 receptor domain-containing protein n=1 Tax=Roseateles agri TaxID=3098619 RepID=A0ABU5DN78_9BURK|nr:toll/interleukin-1 receptor domain-containing protein [Paucibacter sp. R3-3]MDY0747769.1 toll/interleukin-1 receptor domain-containing protein [Paucibacter sp. R3-3]
MPRIFISYRRDDSAGQAGRLYDHLARHYGEDAVFMDVDGIDLGTGFAAALERALADCEALLVVIGRSWTQLADAATGRPRILLDDDWVRREIATTLASDLPVIPGLFRGRRCPLPVHCRQTCRTCRVARPRRWTIANGRPTWPLSSGDWRRRHGADASRRWPTASLGLDRGESLSLRACSSSCLP